MHPPLQLDLKPSHSLFILLCLIHIGAIAAIGFSKINWGLALIIAILCLISLLLNLRRYVLLVDKRSIIKIWQELNGQWCLKNYQGDIFSGELHGSSLRTTYLVLLNFKIPNKRRLLSVVIMRDAVDVEDFRKLRARLLVG